MGSTEQGIVYVCDMGAAPEMALSVYSARLLHPDLPITVIALDLSNDFIAYLKHLHVNVKADTLGCYDAMYAQKRHVFMHSFYDATLYVDADTVFVNPVEDRVWDLQPNAVKIHRIPWIPYTRSRFLPVYEAFDRDLQTRYPMPPEDQYAPIGIQAGILLLNRSTHPVFKGFFGSISQEVWRLSHEKRLAGDQGLLHFVCQSKGIALEHLDRRYNFYCNYHNQDTLWDRPAEETFEVSFVPAIVWKEAIILHYNVHWPETIPRRFMRLAALRGALNLMDRHGIGSKDEFRQQLTRFDPATTAEALDRTIPVPHQAQEKSILRRTHKKFYLFRRNLARAVTGARKS
jgi:hypothetical protein